MFSVITGCKNNQLNSINLSMFNSKWKWWETWDSLFWEVLIYGLSVALEAHPSSKLNNSLKASFKECVVLGRHFNQMRKIFMPKQTEWTNSLCFSDWINKLTITHNTISYCFTFICGEPCHVSSFKQRSVDLIFHWEQLVNSVIVQLYTPFCHYLVDIWLMLKL